VELRGENIIPGHRAGKALAIFGFTRGMGGLIRRV
jgi:hypothetical protein